MGEIVAIWIKRAHKLPMDRASQAELIAGRGLKGNADQGGKRQITIIEESAWRHAEAELGTEVDPSARRANVMVRGVELEDSGGRTLRLGSCLVRIYGETRPCYVMDNAKEGLLDALSPHWRAGVFGEIVEGGVINLGDAVDWDGARS